MKKHVHSILISLVLLCLCGNKLFAQGTWATLVNAAPDYNGGVMILLTDGTVMVLTGTGPGGYGNTWDLLTPDSKGSYVNGTWTQLPPMNDGRLYCATQVLPDGNVYVAGGEYGDGDSTGELYNTTTQTWTYITGTPNGWHYDDGSSELLYDGTVLQGAVLSNEFYVTGESVDNTIYHESGNVFDSAAECYGGHDEATWIKLPDSSVINIDIETKNSERYIPQQKKWVKDATLPTYIYDFTLGETGPGFLLPNGKLFFLSDSTYSVIYTPSGSTKAGSWTLGPALPVIAGIKLGCPDASAAMLPTGNILCTFSPAQTYNGPTYLFEYNYITNKFTQVSAPAGETGDTISGVPAYATTMLNLPDGTILFADQGDNNYYQYTPSGTPLVAGKPTIDHITSLCPNFMIAGKLFNGISEGACYGDDWQMATNYPIVRLTSGTNEYYARTTNWNRVGAVMTGNAEDTAYFTIPSGIPNGTYSVQVIANGIASAGYNLTLPCTPSGMQPIVSIGNAIKVYPNPSHNKFNFEILNNEQGVSNIEVFDMLGQKIQSQLVVSHSPSVIDLSNEPNGFYFYRVTTTDGTLLGSGKLILQK
jgi:hypothetical protein